MKKLVVASSRHLCGRIFGLDFAMQIYSGKLNLPAHIWLLSLADW